MGSGCWRVDGGNGAKLPPMGVGVVDGGGWSRPDQAENNLKKVLLFVIYLWSGY